MTGEIRVILADDHPFILDGLERLFMAQRDFTIVGRATNGIETLDLLRQLNPDVLILDIRMPVVGGIEVLRAIRQEKLPTRVILLTAALDDAELVEAFRLDIDGVVLKEMAPRKLLECVRRVLAGEKVWENVSTESALRKLLHDEGRSGSASLLTPRELEISRMVAAGLRNKEIGVRLNITEGTVKLHLHSIYEKLHVDGRVALTLFVRDHGLF